MTKSLKKIRKMALWGTGAGLALAGLYAAAGVYLLPYLLRTQVLPRVAAELNIQLTAQSIVLDPFDIALEVRDIALKDRAGKPLLDLAGLDVDLAVGESLRAWQAVFSVDVRAPTLHLVRETGGNLNLMALAPPEPDATEPKPPPPFLLTHLRLEQGRIEFQDATAHSPFRAVFAPLDIVVENLGPEAERKATFTLAVHGGERETLSAHGGFTLAPFALDGGLEATGWALAPWAAYLAPESPWRLRSGTGDVKADYALRVGEKPEFAIQSGAAHVEHLTLVGPESREAAIADMNLAGLALAEQRLRWDSLDLKQVATPWLNLAALNLQSGTYALAEQRLKLNTLTLRDAVAQSSPKAQGKPPRIGLVRLADIDAALKRHLLDIGLAQSERAEIDLWRTATGAVGASGLPELPAKTETSPAPAASPWIVRVAEVRLADYAMHFEDASTTPPVRLAFGPAALHMTDFTTEPGRQFLFRLDCPISDKGKLEIDGQGQLSPLRSEMRFGVDKLWLPALQAYWASVVGFDLTKGRLNLWGDLILRQEAGQEPSLDYSGAADVVDFAMVDRREHKDLIRWNSLKFDGFVVGTRPKRVSIRTITADKSYARVFIAADGGLNLARDLVAPTPPAKTPPKPTPAADRWPVVIGAVRVADGRMDFTDQTLQPNFATQIQDLNGSIRGLSSQENAKADLFLEGRINQNSPVKIYGQTNPARFGAHTDITMEFRGVNLTTLSPYSGKFAGYRIEKGKLDMDLHYKLHERALSADNRVVLDQLTLGERVDSPTATSLPVDFAVALLKDAHGRIDIELPLSGHLDDPRFSLRDLYTTAVTHLFTKLVGSPFSLLSNLVPDGHEDLGHIGFQPGEATLSQDDKDKLDKIALALKQRPGLSLDIRGMADPRQDRPALAEAALLRQLRNDKAAEPRTIGERAGVPSLSDADYRRLFARYYRQSHPAAPEAQALATVPDGAAYDQARRKVLEQWAVSELELRLLAQARGESIREYLVREAGLPDKRIYLLDVNLVPLDDHQIKVLLSLSG